MSKTTPVAGKLNAETYDKLTNYLDQNPDLTKSSVIAQAVEVFLNGDQPPAPFDLSHVENLTEENQQLKLQVSILTNSNNELKEAVKELTENADNPEQITQLQTTINQLQSENQQLKESKTNGNLSVNQFIIEVPESLQPFLHELAARETNRTGKKVTIQMILLNLFWAQVTKGAGDHLPRTFSDREIKRILETVKNQKNEH